MQFLFSAEAIEILAAVLGAVATAIGGAAGAGLFEKLRLLLFEKDRQLSERQASTAGSDTSDVRASRASVARAQVERRIYESRVAMLRNVRIAKWGRFSSTSMTFGQYVIGAVMTSAFAQKNLSPNIIGVFGLVVIISSALKQHYHPDGNVQKALQGASQLEKLIKQSEDRLVVIETTASDDNDPTQYLELLERVTSEMSKIASPAIATPMRSIVSRAKQ